MTLVCARPCCGVPLTGRKKYCSQACSAKVRNRRYYSTLNGRLKKRAAASRYFQRHKQELYEKKDARLARLFRVDMAAEMQIEGAGIPAYQPDLFPIVEAKVAPSVMRRVRFWHDFHPRQFHDWHGKVRWLLDWTDGRLKRYWVRGPYQTEMESY